MGYDKGRSWALSAVRILLGFHFFSSLTAAVSTMSRIAVVTGSNKGIGLEIAKKLAKAPGHICILTSRNEARGQKAVEDLKREGMEIRYKQLDINDPTSIERFASEMENEYGRCDVLVNNAGIMFSSPSTTPFDAQTEITLKTNYFDTVALTERMLPLVRKSETGRIVNVASQLGHLSILRSASLRKTFADPSLSKIDLGRMEWSDDTSEEKIWQMMEKYMADVKAGRHLAEGWPSAVYGVSKLGLIAYTNVLARLEKGAGTGVLVNSCCPGYCSTDLTQHKGYLSPEYGARTPFMLTQLSGIRGDPSATGKFFTDGTEVEW